ncbi:MAG: PstS family phosphate ABC transporter substrate-binding protein [Alphaproteobacteria bacterium]|nr:PstS family phosphate ABC transporter substrate-binding protein [Alphaproteobacteria bacterium]
MLKQSTALAAVILAATAVAAEARDQIRIVGSSTVFPFSTAVAEEFGKTSGFKTPIVESTGTGGGMKLFCGGVGVDHPDITNASRVIKESEVKLCAENDVAEIVEVKIGFDGIVIANARASGQIDITLQQVFLALAKEVPVGGQLVANPFKTWSDIDGSLPDVAIEVLGPPPTSGSRDAFVELAMEGGCKGLPEIDALKESDEKRHKGVCQTIREDGAFVEAGENDNLIIQKLEANPDAFGVFGYSFLDQNLDRLQGSMIAGVEPTFEAIAAGDYPVSRSLYFYVKKAHLGVVPGIAEFVAEFTSDKAMGEEGYLAGKGLIPLPADVLDAVRSTASTMTPLAM